MSSYELLGTLEIGFVFSFVALGAYLTFRILDFPDLTVEGSFPLGAAVCASLIVGAGWSPWPATLAGAAAGFVAGYATAYLNVRFNILHILAGILVAISLYSINLRIMNGPNKPLLGVDTVITAFEGHGISAFVVSPIFMGVLVLLVVIVLNLFLRTGYGISMRTAGANPAMAEANGINVGRMKLFGVGIANAMTAPGGALFAQIFGAADVFMGIGVIIVRPGLGHRRYEYFPLPHDSVGNIGLYRRGDLVSFCRCGRAQRRLSRTSGLRRAVVTAILVTLALIAQHSRGKFKRAIKWTSDK